jgi:hypothetical protein
VRKKEVPRPMLVVVELLGGLALGWAVFLWVSGSGGWGPGQGGLLGLGGGTGTGEKAKADGKGTDDTPAKKEPPAQPTALPMKPGLGTLRIDMLGGARVKDERFYLLEGRPGPVTFDELRQAILDRQEAKGQALLQGIEIVIYENSVAQDHPAVRNLEKWAREHDLAVTLTFPKRELP